MTVVTQFISSGGNLSEIKRFYVQNGRVIANAPSTFPSLSQYNSLTDQVCAAQKSLFGDVNDFADNGGMRAMGQGFQKGMVLAMSVWDDFEANMLWLDGEKYPLDKDPSQPGIARGECTLGMC